MLEATALPTEPPPLPNNLYYVALDVTATCISEIHCFAQDGFDLNIVRKLSSKKKKYQQSRDSNPGLLGGKQKIFLCATQPQRWLGGTSLARVCGTNGSKVGQDLMDGPGFKSR